MKTLGPGAVEKFGGARARRGTGGRIVGSFCADLPKVLGPWL